MQNIPLTDSKKEKISSPSYYKNSWERFLEFIQKSGYAVNSS